MTDRDEAIRGFLGKLSVRDLRHLARGRKVEEYKTMKKKDLASQLFDKHFMSQRDKDKFAPVKQDEEEKPVPNFAKAPKGLSRSGVRNYASGTVMAEGAPERPAGLIREAPVYVSPGARKISVVEREKKEAEERKAREAEREAARKKAEEEERKYQEERKKAEKERQERKKKEEVAKELRRVERERKKKAEEEAKKTTQRPKKFRPKIAEEVDEDVFEDEDEDIFE